MTELSTKSGLTKVNNITYDQYKSTRNDVAIDTSSFNTQGLVIKAISDYADKKHITRWHKALSTPPTNIYSFVIRYLNNTFSK